LAELLGVIIVCVVFVFPWDSLRHRFVIVVMSVTHKHHVECGREKRVSPPLF